MSDTRIDTGGTHFGKQSAGSAIFDSLNAIFMILAGITFLYPFWITILTSFSGHQASMSLGFHLWLSEWYTTAYRFAFSRFGRIGVAYGNTIFRTVAGTALIVSFTLLGAYPLSKKRLPGRNLITIFFLITMFFGGGLIPTYLLIRRIGLLNNRLVYILPLATNAFYIIIMRNFIMTIDDAYEEAAFVDGASYFQILVRIIIPLSKPVIATIVLWAAVAHWNAWFDGLIYITHESKHVLQLFLRRLMTEVIAMTEHMERFAGIEEEAMPSYAVQAAVTVLTIGPIILVYPFIQRYFIKGIFIGSLKG